MSESIAFIGFGEAGQTISRGLATEKAKPSIRAYDILFGQPAGATLEAIGLEPLMAVATARRQQWVADLGVGAKTEDRAELVKAIREAMGK